MGTKLLAYVLASLFYLAIFIGWFLLSLRHEDKMKKLNESIKNKTICEKCGKIIR